MKHYYIIKTEIGTHIIIDTRTGKDFSGYDFMGGVEWADCSRDAYHMDKDEADAILADLEAAD